MGSRLQAFLPSVCCRLPSYFEGRDRMMSLRIKLLLGGMGVLAVPTGAAAQLSESAVVDILRECRKIGDVAARAACYDNIPLGQPGAAPLEQAPAASPSAAPAASPAPSRFGSNQLPQARGAEAGEPEQINARVTAVTQREPGIYLLTMEDGAQWQFVDAAPSSYDAPRRGSEVEIFSAALGSYQIRYAGQRALR